MDSLCIHKNTIRSNGRMAFHRENGDAICATGAIIDIDGHMLLINEVGKKGWSDLGGKVEHTDICPYSRHQRKHCVIGSLVREIYEETNGKLFGKRKCQFPQFKSHFLKLLTYSIVVKKYVKHSKYLLFYISVKTDELPPEIRGILNMNIKRFDNIEESNGTLRKFKWFKEIPKGIKVNPRICICKDTFGQS